MRREIIEKIETERDRLLLDNEKLRSFRIVQGEEIDRLKAEVEGDHLFHVLKQAQADRDAWKAKAEKLAGALKDVSQDNVHNPVCIDTTDRAYEICNCMTDFSKSALDEYGKGV